MQVVFITGTPGSGKSTLELNIRNNQGVGKQRGDFIVGEDIVFLGNYMKKDGIRYLRYPGLDSMKKKNKKKRIISYIKKAESMGHKHVVMSGIMDISSITNELKEYTSFVFLINVP